MSSRRLDPTPCTISKSSAEVINSDTDTGRNAVILHERANPCAHCLDDGTPTFVEIVEGALAHRKVSVRRCSYCGEGL